MTVPAGDDGPILTDIDHVAIAVHDLDAAVAHYRSWFGADVAHREVVASDGVEEALLKVGVSYVQLVTPDPRRLAGGQVPGEAGRGSPPRGLPGDELRRPPSSGQGQRRTRHRPGPPARLAGDDRRLHPSLGRPRYPHRTGGGVARHASPLTSGHAEGSGTRW